MSTTTSSYSTTSTVKSDVRSPELPYSTPEDIMNILSKTRQGASEHLLLELSDRRKALHTFAKMLDENEADILAAINADLRKHPIEAKVTEVSLVRSEVFRFLDDLDDYAKADTPDVGGIMKVEDIVVEKQPLGVVLVISPWNYPFLLALHPVIGAIAAGNTVILKPSEVSRCTAAIMTKLIGEYFDPKVMGVVNGGPAETTELLKQRFDHICYTGSPMVGRIVMQAAAKHGTPVLLELGGKSPTIVDETILKDKTFLANACRRIMWGRFVNSGQTCVAPDYILVQESAKSALIEAMKKARAELFGGEDGEASESYSRMISDRHFDRVCDLIDGPKDRSIALSNREVVIGGKRNKETRFIDLTVIDNVSDDEPAMTEEIFGPVLPVRTYKTEKEAIDFINAREKPLALYVFSKNKKFINQVKLLTSSGSMLVNDTILQAGIDGVPFGGVGNSGIGSYRGKSSFDTFSHHRVVMTRKAGMEIFNYPRYPPYKLSNYTVTALATERTRERTWVERKVFTMKNTMSCCLVLCGVAVGYLLGVVS